LEMCSHWEALEQLENSNWSEWRFIRENWMYPQQSFQCYLDDI